MKYLEPSAERDRYEAQERLIFTSTELVCDAMEDRGVTRKELADRLGVRPAEVTQRLNGTRNMTLRSLADMFYVLGYDVRLEVRDKRAGWNRLPSWSRTHAWASDHPARTPAVRYTSTGSQLMALGAPAA